jgi:CheY-like chemotaxis protein
MESHTSDLLLVEDNPSDIVVALRAFRRHGFDQRVKVVRDGAEALAYLFGDGTADGHPRPPLPKVVLLDLRMPRIDGRAVLREIRSDESMKEVPIVVVSSSGAEADIRDCYRLGANSFVVKSFDPSRPGEYLIDVARYWLDLNRVAR